MGKGRAGDVRAHHARARGASRPARCRSERGRTRHRSDDRDRRPASGWTAPCGSDRRRPFRALGRTALYAPSPPRRRRGDQDRGPGAPRRSPSRFPRLLRPPQRAQVERRARSPLSLGMRAAERPARRRRRRGHLRPGPGLRAARDLGRPGALGRDRQGVDRGHRVRLVVQSSGLRRRRRGGCRSGGLAPLGRGASLRRRRDRRSAVWARGGRPHPRVPPTGRAMVRGRIARRSGRGDRSIGDRCDLRDDD